MIRKNDVANLQPSRIEAEHVFDHAAIASTWEASETKHLLFVRIASIIAGILLSIAIPFVTRVPSGIVLATFAVLLYVVVSAPVFLRRDFRLYEPMALIIPMVYFGMSAKLVYIIIFAGERDYVDTLLLNGEPPEAMVYGSVVSTIGLLCFLIGYWRRNRGVPRQTVRLPFPEEWSHFRLIILSVLILVVSGVFFVLLARSTGINFMSPESFSQKRFIDLESSDVGSEYREDTLQTLSYYYYRAAAFAKFAFYPLLAWLVYHRKPLLSVTGLLMAWAGLQTVMVFFFMNSRASVALVMLDAVLIIYLLGGRIRLWKIALAGSFITVLLLAQLAMRAGHDQNPVELIEKTVFGRDFMDICKTSLIINAVPHQLDYCYGETLVGWLAAPIPAKLWPDKPKWSERGVTISQRVYGVRSSLTGVTMGFIAELFWNFGWAGICIGMFLGGIGFRYVYVAFLSYRHHLSIALMYALVVTRLTLFTLGSDLGTGILKTALDLIPLALLVLFIGQSRPEIPVERRNWKSL